MVYTVRLAGIGRQGGRNGFEQQLRTWNVAQKNSRPHHPTTCGKVERFQQTLKNWLRAQPDQPATITELQTSSGTSTTPPDPTGPCRTAPPRSPLRHLPKALPGNSRDADTHDRIRHDVVDKSRHRHPASPRPTPPHRHRTNPPPNPRHPAHPGPARPRHQRHHRRAPPGPHHRHHQGLPTPEMTRARTHFRGSRPCRCPETSKEVREGTWAWLQAGGTTRYRT